METERIDLEIIGDAIEASGDAVFDWDLRAGAIQWLGNTCEILSVSDCAEVRLSISCRASVRPVSASCAAPIRSARKPARGFPSATKFVAAIALSLG